MAHTITSTAQRHLRRNLSFGVLNGVFFNLYSVLLDPSLVLSWFVSQLTTSNFLIGLITPILASFASNLLWGRISDRRGNKLLLALSNSLGLLIPLTALSIVPLTNLWPGLRELAPGLFALVFVLSGASKSARMIGNMNFLLEIAPADNRPLYVGFTNTIMGIALLATSVGGLIVDLVGFTVLFSVALAFYAQALFLTLRLQEPRAEARQRIRNQTD